MLAYAKAIVAFIVGALAPLISASVASGGSLTSADLITAAATALASGGAVLGVKNTKAAASSLVVTLKTDADAFLKVFLAGLPTLVTSATQAALSPSAPVAPITVTQVSGTVATAPAVPVVLGGDLPAPPAV